MDIVQVLLKRVRAEGRVNVGAVGQAVKVGKRRKVKAKVVEWLLCVERNRVDDKGIIVVALWKGKAKRRLGLSSLWCHRGGGHCIASDKSGAESRHDARWCREAVPD